MAEVSFLLFKNRQEWRQWLEANHLTAPEIWLGYYKKHTGKASVSYNEAVEEALCFGWIDSKVKSLDKNIYTQKYTPRKKGSLWSVTNVKRVEKMIREGLMTPAGLAKVEEARQNGKWDAAYGGKKEEEVPDDLMAALRVNPQALRNFFNFPLSARNMYIHHINRARQQITREKRIIQVTELAGKNKKPGF